MEIHVCDLTDRAGQGDCQTLEKMGKKNIIKMLGMSNGITYMVDKVIEIAGSNKIEILAFWGHGGSGSMGLSRGEESDRNSDWAGISIYNVESSRSTLERLKNYFAPNAIVELRGCDVASGWRGQALLTALANIWKVRVRAGASTQYGPTLGWAGTVYEAKPGMSGTNSFAGDIQQ